MINETLKRIKERWKQSAVLGRQDQSIAIAKLEQRVGQLPPPYKEFLTVAGEQTDDDTEGFLFWKAEDVIMAKEFFSQNSIGFNSVFEGAIIIADYLQESWYYVLWVGGNRIGHVGLVSGVGDAERKTIGDFSEFLECYLLDSSALYSE